MLGFVFGRIAHATAGILSARELHDRAVPFRTRRNASVFGAFGCLSATVQTEGGTQSWHLAISQLATAAGASHRGQSPAPPRGACLEARLSCSTDARLGVPARALKRASASRPSGEWNDDDYDVLADGVVVGRMAHRGRRRTPAGRVLLGSASRRQAHSSESAVGASLKAAPHIAAPFLPRALAPRPRPT